MNKGLLAFNILLALATGFLFFQYFNKDRNTPGISEKKVNEISYPSHSFSIGLFDMDSIEANFALFREMQKEVSKKEDSMNAAISQMKTAFQLKYQKFQDQRNSLTPVQVDEAGKELTQMDMGIKNKTAELNQNYQAYYMNKQQEIITLIKKFCLEFNKNRRYSLIITNEPGLIYYKDTAFNITSELLKGLNEAYSKKKK